MGMDSFADARRRMIDRQLAPRGIVDPRVLDAFGRVPREEFVPRALASSAYDDAPLPIGDGQTISQPYVVALMAQSLDLRPDDRVLEVGTGSGYAAAIASLLAREIVTVERLPSLAAAARDRLDRLGFRNVDVRVGDGSLGWAERAPYDAIFVAAAGPQVPPALLAQLAIGGRLILPIGADVASQRLLRFTRASAELWREEVLGDVRFVPLIGAQGWDETSTPPRLASAAGAR